MNFNLRSEGDIVAFKRMIWLKFSSRSYLGCTVDNGADGGWIGKAGEQVVSTYIVSNHGLNSGRGQGDESVKNI